jgi:hypothetical protein
VLGRGFGWRPKIERVRLLNRSRIVRKAKPWHELRPGDARGALHRIKCAERGFSGREQEPVRLLASSVIIAGVKSRRSDLRGTRNQLFPLAAKPRFKSKERILTPAKLPRKCCAIPALSQFERSRIALAFSTRSMLSLGTLGIV